MSRRGWHGDDLPLLLHLHGAPMVWNQHHHILWASPVRFQLSLVPGRLEQQGWV